VPIIPPLGANGTMEVTLFYENQEVTGPSVRPQ
jgi:hypothetical protein